MSTTTDLEKEVLALPAAEREQLAAAVWESLVSDPGSSNIDPEGIETALQRDAELNSGATQTIGHAEFMKRTSGSENEG